MSSIGAQYVQMKDPSIGSYSKPDASLLSLPPEVFSEILSNLSFYVLWHRIRVLGSPILWKMVTQPHGYCDMWQTRATLPGISTTMRFDLSIVFPTLSRFCIHLPGTTLLVDHVSIYNLPSTLVEIDIECVNAETLFVEPIYPTSSAPIRSMCFQTACSPFEWGMTNINVGRLFPQLTRLRLMGVLTDMSITLPSSQDERPITPFVDISAYRAHHSDRKLKWTYAMAYNFVRELPSQTLRVLTCNYLLTHALGATSPVAFDYSMVDALPLPPSLTEVNGRIVIQNRHFDPSFEPFVTSVNMDPNHVFSFQSLRTLKCSGSPSPSAWIQISGLPVLTSLNINCPLSFGDIPPSSVVLPATLRTFQASCFNGALQLPPRWFPEKLTKLHLSTHCHVAWGEKLSDYLPPSLEYLKIGFDEGTVDFKMLPATLRVFKFSLHRQVFKGSNVENLPRKLHTFAIYSDFSINKAGWAAFPSTLTRLKTAPVLNGVMSALKQLPGILRLNLYTSHIYEQDLANLPPSIRQLELREVVLTGHSLSWFPLDDPILTSKKWNCLMETRLPPSLAPFWDFQYSCMAKDRSSIPGLAVSRNLSTGLVYLPPHITVLDLEHIEIPEMAVLNAIARWKCQLITLRLRSISLSSQATYPPTLTELEGTHCIWATGSSRTDAEWGPFLTRLVLPSFVVSRPILPESLTYLEMEHVFFLHANCLPLLQTLVLRTQSGVDTLYFPPNLTCLYCPRATSISIFRSSFQPKQKPEKLQILHTPCSTLSLPLVPLSVTSLHVHTIRDVTREIMAQALIKLASKTDTFTSQSLYELLATFWLPQLQNVVVSMPNDWLVSVTDLELLPEHTRTLKLHFAEHPLSSLFATDTLPYLAPVRRMQARPLMENIWSRFVHLTDLDLSQTLLPHYATEWLPRSLLQLKIDHTHFCPRSFHLLPPGLQSLDLCGAVVLRASSAAALPPLLHSLSIHSIKSNAYERLPRGLQMLTILRGSAVSPSSDAFPPSLTALYLPWQLVLPSSPAWSRIPHTLRMASFPSCLQRETYFQRFQASDIP